MLIISAFNTWTLILTGDSAVVLYIISQQITLYL